MLVDERGLYLSSKLHTLFGFLDMRFQVISVNILHNRGSSSSSSRGGHYNCNSSIVVVSDIIVGSRNSVL